MSTRSGTRRVLKIEHDDLLREVTEAHAILAGWAERMAATPGADARFLLKELDAATSRANQARVAIRTTLGLTSPADEEEQP